MYLELLSSDIGPGWLQQLQDLRNDVSTAEVVSSQSSEQNTLGLTADLVANKGFRTNTSVNYVVIANRSFMNSSILDCRCWWTDAEDL